MIARTLAIATLLSAAGLPGCGSVSGDPRSTGIASDLTVDAVVFGPDRDGPVAPLAADRRSAHYVLLPDRTLRAAVGGGVSRETLPRVVRRISHREFESVARLLAGGGLMSYQPPAPAAEDEPATTYDVELLHRGQRRRIRVARGEHEGVDRLIDRLARFAGVKPVTGVRDP